MAQKDISEKRLENFADVFADIVNVLLFDGNRLINPLDLLSDELDSNGKPKKSKQRFPVITLVLYFGYEKHWTKRRKLSDFVSVPAVLKPYFNDYKLNVFEIAWLDYDTIAKFESDFRYVADFFVQMRKHKNYKPSNWQIKHVAAFLDLMSVLTGDYRFAQSYSANLERSVSDMKIPFLDEVENRGIEKGREQGRAEGRVEGSDETILANLRSVMRSFNVPIEKAMDSLQIPKDQQPYFLARLGVEKTTS